MSEQAPPPTQVAGPTTRAWSDRAPRWIFGPETALLIGLLAVYAATTNTRGLYHASLHQGVVKALVENHTLYIRDYDPREPLGGDVFIRDGHVYANKQPGSFLLGAAVYWVLRPTGLSYDRDFYLTAALVGVLTSGLLTALTAVLVYRAGARVARPAGWARGRGARVRARQQRVSLRRRAPSRRGRDRVSGGRLRGAATRAAGGSAARAWRPPARCCRCRWSPRWRCCSRSRSSARPDRASVPAARGDDRVSAS